MSGLTRRLAFVGFCLLPLGSGTQLHAQGASLSSTSLIFGNQAIATSSAKSVRLTNTGTAPLLITYLTQPSTPFSENDNCPRSPASLAPKAFCTISVTFSSTAPGAFSSAIKIADNASDSPQIISLKGTGVPQATLSPTPLTFGSVGVGSTSTAETATLQNNLNTSLSITSIVAS